MTPTQLQHTWQRLYPALLGFVQKRVHDTSLASDILQDVFLKILERRSQLREEQKVEAWVYQILRNAIHDHYRAEQKRMEFIPVWQEVDSAEASKEEKTHERFAQCVPGMLDALPDKYRTALQLIEIEGLSQKELAAQLGISYSGAKSRVQRGRQLLKDALLTCCAIKADAYGNIIDYQKRCAC
ncbi:MAG: RNA polymerase sigma factor SigZ [Bacteroidota bacterium]